MTEKIKTFFQNNFTFVVLSTFWLMAVFNPYFKKYDFSSGWPLAILLGCVVFFISIAEFKKQREKSRSRMVEMAFLAIFGLGFALSFLFSENRTLGFTEVLVYLSLIPLYLNLAFQEIRWKERFLKISSIALVAGVILGFVIYFWRAEVRMIGPFFNIIYHANVWPNAFGLFILLLWPVLFYFLVKTKRSTLMTFLLALCLALVFSGLLLSYSRGAFIAFAGQSLLFFLYFFRKINFKVIGWVVFVSVSSILLFLGANLVRSQFHEVIDVEERATFGNQESMTSKQERVDFWVGAYELALEKPLFGWGPFSFRNAYNPIQKDLLANSDHPHNIFLKFAAENGFITVFGFIGFLISVFIAVLMRYFKLSDPQKLLVFSLGVAVAGAVAHNLIDYNFNFIANLLPFFLFLAFIRSECSQNTTRLNKDVFALILAVVVFLLALYEGTVYGLSKFGNPNFLEYSLYPRNYYLNQADYFVNNGSYKLAQPYIDEQLKLSPIDPQAWYLKGVTCEKLNESGCLKYYEKALKLNPLNDLNYYREYIRALHKDGDLKQENVDQALKILETYFQMVQNNVHFTAYTTNIEAASLLINTLIPLVDEKKQNELKKEESKMWDKANELRSQKTF